MMDFDLLKGEEKTFTENGALGFVTTKNKLLNLSFQVPDMRRRVCNEADDDARGMWKIYFKDAFNEDSENTLRFLLYLRDIRGGLGERSVFRNVVADMAEDNLELAEAIIRHGNIPEFGRWDDLIDIAFRSKALKPIVASMISSQLADDAIHMAAEKPVSLLAKWLPSEGTSSKKTRNRCRELVKLLGLTLPDYRKKVSALRKYINIVERQMSANQWSDIAYESVPSKANLIYKEAFMRHDEERRKEFIEKLSKGETKINAKTLAPYEILHDYRKLMDLDDVLEELWKGLPTPEKQKNILVVRDGSGSMTWCQFLQSSVTPLDIGDSIALYMAQYNTGCYKDKFITFSNKPQIVDLTGTTSLRRKIDVLRCYNDCSNTDLEKVFQLVLDTVVENKVPQDDIPDILVISDMEFDESHTRCGNSKALMRIIRDQWNEKGYKLPKLIFWNVASRTGAIPITTNDNGVILVSGFTTAIANMVMSNELDPLKALLKVLQVPRYDCVKDILSAID